MPFLVAYVVIIVAFQQCLRAAQLRGRDTLTVTALNYAVGAAALLPVWLALGGRPDGVTPTLAALGAVNGVLFFVNLLVMFRALDAAGVGVTAAAMQTGIVVPPLVAWLTLGEPMTPAQALALAAVPAALWLLRPARGDTPQKLTARAELWLLATFAMTGTIYTLHKLAVHLGDDDTVTRLGYLLCIFTAATAASFAVLRRRRRPITRPDLAWATPVGLTNGFGALALLAALAVLPAAVVYPTAGPSTTAGNTLAAVVLFKERLQPRQLAGIALVIAVVLLVNLPR